jgi:hypothetical protein
MRRFCATLQSRVMIAALALLAASLTAGPATAPGGDTRIVSIRLVRHDVFDLDEPGTSAWPYRWANALHVLSRESFIRSLLLFRVGDPVDPARLAESERLLRDTGFLNPVFITTHAVPGGIEVVVETRDQWTTQIGISYGLYGSRQHSGFTLSEDNVLGYGKVLLAGVTSDTERSTRIFMYEDPLLFGGRWQFKVKHSNASDGTSDSLRLQYPFYSLVTPRAGGGSWDRSSLTEWLFASGQKAVEGDARRRSFSLWAGFRLPGGGATTDRLTLGVFGSRSEFANWRYRVTGAAYPTPEDRDLQGVQVGWDHQVDRWKVVRGFHGWERQEDLPLGPNWSVTAALSTPALGGDRTRLALAGSVGAATLAGDQVWWANGSATGRLESGGAVNTLTHVEVGTARTGPAGWRARLAADIGYRLDGDRQLTLGADTGLRGWEPDTFDGTSRMVANVEWRHRLTGEILHLGIIGVQVFADAGKTTGARVGPTTDGWRSDAGVGLLIESTRAALVRVVRLEVAYPDRGKGPLVLVSSTSLF